MRYQTDMSLHTQNITSSIGYAFYHNLGNAFTTIKTVPKYYSISAVALSDDLNQPMEQSNALYEDVTVFQNPENIYRCE